ncbi:phage major tail protein, TP901-1 family [Fructobacillus sp. M1-13]|uniref:Phage major tail protein, TP901-1 family n=1 Tax=Fructobacillus papyriferae TaxID=2713171 RepID=A0ABS5QR70_9LACO|nr:phage major tail protein, TP901-1 family [Fructobacillus papyriferae]MBS9335000.1 phage major tail protein, TP901-1 family [Fructobacillus papyriferae]MCD2159514.1 phage major tail protein, TP901-1 family [Fructobacillus papyriferae]
MNTPKKGKDKVLMFRLFQDKNKADATRLGLQTTHSIKNSRKTDSTATKDGNIVSPGTLETTIDIEAIASDDLTNQVLAYAQKKGLEVEVWEIDFSQEPQNGKYVAQYGVGYLSDWEVPAEVDSNTTIKTTLTISGELVKGLATVSAVDVATVKNFFRDTVKNPTEVAPIDEAPDYGTEQKSTQSSSATPSK